jgi:hypothetical protein
MQLVIFIKIFYFYLKTKFNLLKKLVIKTHICFNYVNILFLMPFVNTSFINYLQKSVY